MNDQASDRSLRIGHREELASAPGLTQDAAVADLAAALSVERRPVEDDLRLPVTAQVVELDAVPDDRHDPGLGGRRVVPDELGVAGAAMDRRVERRRLGVAGQV